MPGPPSLWEAEQVKNVLCGTGTRPPPPIHPPDPKIPKAPELQPNGCLDCSSYHLNSSDSWDPTTGVETVYAGDMECDGSAYFETGGTDLNGDGICDGGVLEMVTEYNSQHHQSH